MDPLINSFSTHLPLLAWAVKHATGPVIELGCGGASTPLLHLLCADRALFSLDNSPEWIERFEKFRRPMPLSPSDAPGHVVSLVENWEACELIEKHDWGVAFVDSAPSASRVPLIRRLKDRARLIVVHDTEPGAPYNYQKVLPEFPHRADCTWWPTGTSIVSMTEDLSCLRELL